MKTKILIVDAYNVIGNWKVLRKLKDKNMLDKARDCLLKILLNYNYYVDTKIIVVFDAMYVPGITKKYEYYNLDIVFTKKDETADSYIESLTDHLQKSSCQVTVVTSDQAEQWTVFSRGALRISSREFYIEVKRIFEMEKKNINKFKIKNNNYHLNRLNNKQINILKKIRDNIKK